MPGTIHLSPRRDRALFALWNGDLAGIFRRNTGSIGSNWKVRPAPTSAATPTPIAPENIDALFTRCETILGEGLKDEYWQRVHDHDDPDQAKLELFCILQDPSVRRCRRSAGSELIRCSSNLPRQRSTKCRRAAVSSMRASADRGPILGAKNIHTPDLIEVRKETPLWNEHLFVNELGKFGWQANTWEDMALREEVKGKAFAGWLRNIPRKHWAVCVPYGQGQAEPLYPDMLVFRREGNKVKIDILDPHDDAAPMLQRRQWVWLTSLASMALRSAASK